MIVLRILRNVAAEARSRDHLPGLRYSVALVVGPHATSTSLYYLNSGRNGVNSDLSYNYVSPHAYITGDFVIKLKYTG